METNFLINMIFALLAEIERLKSENASIAEEKSDLEMMMEMASEHADEIGAELLDKVDASIKEIEERVRLISETIPVPVVISRVTDGKILYVNDHSCNVFSFSSDEFLGYNAFDLYDNSSDRQELLNIMSEHGQVKGFETRLKKSGGVFWGALFSQPLSFRNEPCMLTVVYDLTERKQAEEEIRRLNEALERTEEREEKYLMFSLADQEYGIDILKIREIIRIMPVVPVYGTPDYLKGIINLRDKVIPVSDLRIRLELETSDYTDRTCIIIAEAEEGKMIGVIVDSVTEVLGIRGKDIEPSPAFGYETDMSFILGMAKVRENVKILLDIRRMEVPLLSDIPNLDQNLLAKKQE
ncbi:chemotaxis protein CheW [Desulfococcaceae bacterium HSG8]|nr:chemotaxis protein CheW [Desulfococcaceae bacterium HSG8]